MITYSLLGLAAIFILMLIIAATKPNTVRYERSTIIAAPPSRILTHIADFHNWKPWSPWEKMDPGMKRDYSGAASGKGAKYAWTSSGKAGEGSMEVLEATDRGVHIDLQFVRPFKNTCDTWFKFEPEGSNTRVVWIMTGPNLFIGKVMGLFINMEKMIGRDFESGLAELKATVEKGSV